MTPKQEQLKQIHGTPEEFRAALTRALGDIYIDGANTALARYQADWDAAGASDQEATSAPPLTEDDIQWKRFEKLYSVKYGWTPHPDDASTRSALAWFKAGLAYTSTIMGVRAMMEKMTAVERDSFVNWVDEQGRQLRGASRNGGTRPSKRDFVAIVEGKPWRIQEGMSGETWLFAFDEPHISNVGWRRSSLLHPDEVERFYEKALSVEEAKEYERGMRFLGDEDRTAKPSRNDFVFIEDGVPFRVSKLDSGWWIMVWHADKKWVLSRSIHETAVHFYYEKAIPLEQARLYEAGVPFKEAEASAPPPEKPAGDQPAPEGT